MMCARRCDSIPGLEPLDPFFRRDVFATMMSTDSASASTRSFSRDEEHSLFAYSFARGAAGKVRREATQRHTEVSNPVELLVGFAPHAARILRQVASAVGLSPPSLLSRMVPRLCREMEEGRLAKCRSSVSQEPVEPESAEATRTLFRVSLRRADVHRLRQLAATMACAPTDLMEQAVHDLHGRIKDTEVNSDMPLGYVQSYRLLVHLLHSGEDSASGSPTIQSTE